MKKTFIRKSRWARGFTLVELTVVLAAVAILSTVVFYGIGRSRSEESAKADYLNIYEQLKSLKLRGNLGKLGYPTTTVQTSTFSIGQSTYWINGRWNSFSNKSIVHSIRYRGVSYSAGGIFTIFFYPAGYAPAVPPTNFGTCVGCRFLLLRFTEDLIINISRATSPTVVYPIKISGSGKDIYVIDKMSPSPL